MAGEQQLGNIVYQVEMELGKLITSQQQVNSRLDQMEGKFDATAKSVDRAEKSMFSLSKVAGALTTALSVQQVASYAEAWTVLNNKLVNSIKTGETLADVNQRVFDIAQESRSSLDGIATLYSRMERAMRDAGVSGKELGQITTTISKAMTISGATAAESEGALVQLSQALASGVLRGQEFNSMSEQAPALMKGLSDSLGVSIGQLRAMAAEGKLTTDVLLTAFRDMAPTVEKEFANTMMTMSQSLTIANNNITQFVGSSTTVKSSVSAFNGVVVSLSENLDAMSLIIGIVATVVGSRYVGALTLASAAKVKGALDAQALAKAELQTAQAAQFAANAAVRKALADKEAAISALNLAQAEYNVAKGSAAEALALDNLSAKKSIAIAVSADLVVAENSLATASNRTSAAARAASVAWTSAKGALALVGGPTGVAFLAGAALFYFYQRSEEAKKSALDLANAVNSLIGKMKEMSNIQLASEIGKLRSAIPDLNKVVNDAQHAFDLASRKVRTAQALLNAYGNDTEKAKKYTAELTSAQDKQNIALDSLTNAQNALGQATNGAEVLQSQLNGTRKEGIELLKRDNQEVGVATGLMKQLGAAINFANRAKGNFNSTSLSVKRDPKAQKVLDDLYQQNELLAETDLRKRAQLKTEQELRALGADESTIRIGREQAGAAYDKQVAQAALKKETAAVTKEETAAEAAEKRRVKSLQDLSNEMAVAELKTKGLNREAAQLAAVQDLGSGASQQQIQQATQQAGQIFDIQQRMADKKAAIDADSVAKAEQQRKLDLSQLDRQLAAGNISFEQSQQRRAQIAANYSKAIAEASAASSVSPQQQNAALVDPVQALANENAQKLALIQKFEEDKTLTEQQALALRNAANTQYEQARLAAQWDIWRNQSQSNQYLASSIDALGQRTTNMLTGLLTGTQSAEEAMKNLAATIIQEGVNALVQMGMQQVKNMIMGQAAATAALAATATQATAAAAAWAPAAVSASIATMGGASTVGTTAYGTALAASKGLALAGARKNGGPVLANSMYRVGEGGEPEILQQGNHNYLLNGDRTGNVISNKDMQGGSGGGGTVVQQEVNFHITTTNGIDDATMSKMATMMKQVAIFQMKDQSSRPGGFLQPRKVR
ncbi:hypothetical protein DVP14_20945 [Yersinia enterocolitica]|nr:hypothetical protein [Yersinia enterocolitica]EKN6076167.1 hypothetical protein [Yersinia enterocolitica]